MHQADGQVEPALHPARVARDRLARAVGQAHALQDFLDAFLEVGVRHAIQAAPEEQVLLRVEHLVESDLLRDEAEEAFGLARGVPEVVFPQHDRAVVRPEQAGDHGDGRGLAGAVRPEQAEQLAARHLEGDAVNGPQFAEPLGQALD